ncbi:shikimate dehydrogenase [Actibacterium sp.]|uniref:shikimate dehydrogenase family protein n=1 Tax=Actibacterium sp. TaxID=1872125 RepID=UPI00356905E5
MDVRLDGETQLFPIVGDPIAQVKSPALLTGIMVARAFNGMVVPIHVSAEKLEEFITSLRDIRNVGGVVVTVPHKPASLALCDQPSERARLIGSVNVMRRLPQGGWTGDNTDGQGYMDGVAARGFDVAGKRALLVGVGGAGAAVAYEILQRGASFLAIHDLDQTRRETTIAKLDARFPGRVGAGSSDPTGFDFVANVTPVGMRDGDPLPVEADKLTGREFVADAITKPEVTPMLKIARDKGCNTMPGLGMFNAQADILVDFLLGQGATVTSTAN